MTPTRPRCIPPLWSAMPCSSSRPPVYDVSTSTFPVDEGMFTATCRRVRDAGFKATFGKAVAEDGDDASDGNPWLDAGEHRLSGIACTVRREGDRAAPSPIPRAPSSPTWPPSPSTSRTRRSRPSSSRRTTARRGSTAASAPRPPARPSSKSSRSAATSKRSRASSARRPRRAPSTTCFRPRLPVPT